MFYDDLVKYYLNINLPSNLEHIGQIDKNISWYLADNNNQFISVSKNNGRRILNIDIKSAFPTICYTIFDKNDEFIKIMDSLEDKKSKNIHIATTLKQSGWLLTFNKICKMIIFGILYNMPNNKEITILELKKDGILIITDDENNEFLNNMDNINNEFLNLLNEYNFKIHVDEYNKYYRVNKTSYYSNNTQIEVKGIYKYLPKYLYNTIKTILLYNDFNNKEELLKIYSDTTLKIIRKNNIISLLNQYYICENGKILDKYLKYQNYTFKIDMDAKLYLQNFIYPALISSKID